MKIYIGADHRGFELKEKMKPWLTAQGHEVVDCGNTVLDPVDDYPDFAFAVAERVVGEPQSRGIVVCGSGVGVTVAANKIKGARSTTATSAIEVQRGREDDDINVLALSADYVGEVDAQKMITAFLSTGFKNDARHARRLNKIIAREATWSK